MEIVFAGCPGRASNGIAMNTGRDLPSIKYFIKYQIMVQSSGLEPVGHGVYRYAVNRQLLSKMLRGHFASGQRLVLADLAEQLEVSITPVREAMLDLAALGMIEFRPNRGAVARSFGPAQLREIYHLRRILESEAARCACGLVPEDKLVDLQNQLMHVTGLSNPCSSSVAIETDRMLHQLIAEHCGNRRLQDEICRYDVLMQAIRDVVGNHNHIQKRAAQEHLEIVRALRKRDAPQAALRMTEHIDRTCREVAEILWPATIGVQDEN